jgi:membrane associated rhomboid family serine protease
MARIPRTATAAIAAVTALAWLVAAALGLDEQAALSLGFIPGRLGGSIVPWPALPVALTPLGATLVHSGLIHIAFNLLVLMWCGTMVERVLGSVGIVILYLIGAYAAALLQWAADTSVMVPMVGASGAISAIVGAYALSFGRAQMFTRSPALNRWINAIWLMVAWTILQAMMGWLAGGQGYLLATPAHVGGFAAGLVLQRPLLLWRYRKA